MPDHASEIHFKALESLKLLRAAHIQAVRDVSESDLVKIPQGLRNNLHWQLGHILTVHGSLLYRRFGEPFPYDSSYLDNFGKRTSPADWSGPVPPVSEIIPLLSQSVEQAQKDLPRMVELNYPEPITVSTGSRLSSFSDALLFLPVHDAVHLGAVNVMRRLLLGSTA